MAMFTCRSAGAGVVGSGVMVADGSGVEAGTGDAVAFVVTGVSLGVVDAGVADAGGVWGAGAGGGAWLGAWLGAQPARRSEALNRNVIQPCQTGLRRFFIRLALGSCIVRLSSQG